MNSADISFVIEPSGPTSPPVLRFAAARSLLMRISRLSMYACARRCRVSGSATPLWRSRRREIGLPPTVSPLTEPAPDSDTRSFMSVVIATRQPSPSGPMRIESGTRTLSKNTSLNSASPVIWTSGRTVTPGDCMSTMKYVRPLCFGTEGSVRARSIPHFARWARLVQTFWPLTTHSSPSRTARVDKPATSEPAPGSLNIWHQISWLVASGRSRRRRCSSVPHVMIVGPPIPMPMMLKGRGTR